jgi:hypothetical protein
MPKPIAPERMIPSRPRIAFAALAFTLLVGAAHRSADAGPVKHWGTFPGAEVRAIAFRGGDFGAEPGFTAIQGRDGYIYLRGRYGLYRVLDRDGRNERIADTSECAGLWESQGVDDRTWVPRAICTRASEIILASATWHEHIRTPLPPWAGPSVPTPGDDRYLTAVVPAAGGGYWFSYGFVGGVGRTFSTGRGIVRRYTTMGTLSGIAPAGADLYVANDACQVVRIRRWQVVSTRTYDCPPNAGQHLVATADGAVWRIAGEGILERRGGDGTFARWRLAIAPNDVAVARDGTAYVLGAAAGDRHAMIAVIRHGRAPQIRVLPMEGAGTIAIDRRDRLWISVPSMHAAALIALHGAPN